MNAGGPSRRRLVYLYRVLCALCALSALWALVLALTGGFSIELGGLRISSRRPRNAAVISLFFAVLVWLVSLVPGAREMARNEWSRWQLWYASTNVWRNQASRFIQVVASPLIVATAAIVIDIYQWSAALPLWVDEEMIALNVRDRSVGNLAGHLWLGQSAPFGWLVVERAAMSVLGLGEHALRAVPLLFGIATVGAAAWVGRRWMGQIAAVVFVLLCWISTFLSHYRFEVKHYTADVLFGLMLPALAAWAIEAQSPDDRARRIWLWWMAAIIGHWISNGALFVTPACAIFLFVAVWRRDGTRAVAWFSLGGLLWLASFALNYLSSLRYTQQSTYFRAIWGTELLPPSLGVIGTLGWFLDRFEPLALNPGATTLWAILWISALSGWAFAAQRRLGIVFAGVVVSAFVLSPVVPLHQRFSIWMVPALYGGVVLLVDRAVALGRNAIVRRRWPLFVVAAIVLFVQFQLCADIVARGRAELDARRHSRDKHQLDDRAAVRWLISQRRPGDVLMTTHLALPAVWWYGDIPISDEAGAGSVQNDGSPVYEVDVGTDCPSRELESALTQHDRVLLYLGFDVIPGLDQALLANLGQLGGMTAHREFSQLGRAAVIDLRMPASDRVLQLKRDTAPAGANSGGCVKVRRAERW